jgi:hypothetical protein
LRPSSDVSGTVPITRALQDLRIPALSLTALLFLSGFQAPLAAQDAGPSSAADSSCQQQPAASPLASAAAAEHLQLLNAPDAGGNTAAPADATATADANPIAPPRALPQSQCSLPEAFLRVARDSTLWMPRHEVFPDGATDSFGIGANSSPISDKVGKWGGEQWRPALLQALGFTLGQHAFRLATEQKTRRALTKETFGRYWAAVTGLHTWSDGGKTWTVYVAHPAQGAVWVDIWVEHDPHGALVPFGRSRAYWISHWKAFWWNAAWELQWKFGPFSEASIGNVGLIPGKLGANTIVATSMIGWGLSIGEDMMDRYVIAKLEKKTGNRAARALLRSWLNPDRSMANVLRKKYPWYRDTRPTLRSLQP